MLSGLWLQVLLWVVGWDAKKAAADPEDTIVNMTNGVTPRRWVHCANPALSAIFTKYLGSHERLVCNGGLL